jgi:hypothetical protein
MVDVKFLFWYLIQKVKLGFQMFLYDVKLSFADKHSLSENVDEYFRIRNMSCSELKEYLKGKEK